MSEAGPSTATLPTSPGPSSATATTIAVEDGKGDVEMKNGEVDAADGTAEDVAKDGEEVEEVEPIEPKEPAFEVVYINNLNEKVKLKVMKQSLTTLFKEYGKVMGVTLHGNVRMRGQAFVTLQDPKAAELAIKEVKGFPLYGKPMQLSYAKTKSDVLVKKKDAEALDEHLKERAERKKVSRRENPLRKKALQKRTAAKKAAEAAALANPDGAATTETTTATAPRRQVQMQDDYLPPNKLLFIQNLPSSTTKATLESIFSVFTGLVEVRTIPGRSTIAFVEFGDEIQSAVAKEALHNTKPFENDESLGAEEAGLRIKVTFAKM